MDFYVRVMRGRVRPDGPGARIKFTRDWEYPWALTRAQAHPGLRVLDCGAGYSPLPFLWATRGASVWAIDRDSMVASRARYARWCVARAWHDLRQDLTRTRVRSARGTPATRSQSTSAAATSRGTVQAPAWRGNAISRFLKFHWRQNQQRLSRLHKPDFWGPVSPTLLRQHGVTYLNADLTRLPFETASFDVVTCISVLEHLPEPARFAGVTEMARVLKPGGRLIVTYDLVSGDITESLLAASGCRPEELVYFRASRLLYAANAPDVVGMVALK